MSTTIYYEEREEELNLNLTDTSGFTRELVKVISQSEDRGNTAFPVIPCYSPVQSECCTQPALHPNLTPMKPKLSTV